MRLLHAFQGVERVAYAADSSRRENDAEHTFFLAMLSWYLSDSLGLRHSTDKLLRYALVHDLVEAYAGDSYIFDCEARETKKEREAEAQERIKKEFPEFVALHEAIEAYEQQGDPEAIFVHAVDKLIPLVINYVQDGKTWKDFKVSHADLVTYKRAAIGEHHKEVRDLLEQFLALIDQDRGRYFNA